MALDKYRRICITRWSDQFAPAQALLSDAGCRLTLGPAELHKDPPYSGRDLAALIGAADAVLTSPFEHLDRRILTSCPNLQAVVTSVIGTDAIDVSAAVELGILVCNSPAPELFIGVAEAAVGFIVALSKKFKINENYLRNGAWYKVANRGELLTGQTLGFVGFGRIAREMALRLANWKMRLQAYDPYLNSDEASRFGVALAPLETVLRESDLVSINAPLTAETHHLIKLEQLRLMKPTAFVLNTSRGAVLKEDDLVEALNQGIIAGAALDVFEQEPLPARSGLRTVDPTRLIMTPHIVGHCSTTEAAGSRVAAESLLAVLEGRIPTTLINNEAVSRWRQRFWS